MASCSYDDSIKLWVQEDDDWECVSTLNGHESTVWWIEFTKDGKYLASASDDTTVKIWAQGDDFESNPSYSLVSTLQGYHKRTVYACSWNGDGDFLATAGADDRICVFVKEEASGQDDLPKFTLIENKQSAHFSDVNCVQFHPTEDILVSCGDDNLIKIWTISE